MNKIEMAQKYIHIVLQRVYLLISNKSKASNIKPHRFKSQSQVRSGEYSIAEMWFLFLKLWPNTIFQRKL